MANYRTPYLAKASVIFFMLLSLLLGTDLVMDEIVRQEKIYTVLPSYQEHSRFGGRRTHVADELIMSGNFRVKTQMQTVPGHCSGSMAQIHQSPILKIIKFSRVECEGQVYHAGPFQTYYYAVVFLLPIGFIAGAIFLYLPTGHSYSPYVFGTVMVCALALALVAISYFI